MSEYFRWAASVRAISPNGSRPARPALGLARTSSARNTTWRKSGGGQPASCRRHRAPGPILEAAAHREHPFLGGVHCTSVALAELRGCSSTASVVHAWDLGGTIGAVNVSVPRS